jgi:hypothetical protein
MGGSRFREECVGLGFYRRTIGSDNPIYFSQHP